MSLIDKQVRMAKLQSEANRKNAAAAYKAFNGTRQEVRNFREGTLNVGTMHFDNTAQDRITKEMVTDYHKKEQERIEERLSGRTKTTLHDTIEAELQTPKVINYGAAPATLDDLQAKRDEMVIQANKITEYKNIIETAPKLMQELKVQQRGFTLRSAGWWSRQNTITDLGTKLKEANRNIIMTQTTLRNLQKELEQIEENIKDNEKEVINANVHNKQVAKKYEEMFNEQNKNLYTVNQQPNESELDYVRRIKDLDTKIYDPALYQNRAAEENSKELMNNLKQVTNDDAKISEIIKIIADPKAIFDINKYWPKFKDTILKIYGPNNKQATASQYAEFMSAILDTIDTKGSLVTVLTGAEPKTPLIPPGTSAPPTPSKPPKIKSGPSVPVVYTLSPDNKTLTLTNTDTGATIYLELDRVKFFTQKLVQKIHL